MKVQFLVTVNVGRRDAQPTKEFEKQDGKAFIPYLKGKLTETIKESYNYNAMTNSVSVKHIK